ncbi:MAG: BolA/IbaG family iron-sulfur metabolism protein [Gammaproteobacteria bacterium]|tara:strand:- start:180 stop:488 length:309 start_codon:yes stop_codon:yes gene_type:complete
MIKEEIENKLKIDCEPWHLEVINESPNHNVPEGAESHFKIIIVSEKFFEIKAVQRHQLIYSVLNEEMKKIHAIAIHPFTPDEWKNKTGESLDSPKCLGGGHD